MKRCLIILLLILLVVLPACQSGGGNVPSSAETQPVNENESAEAETEALDPMEARKLIPDDLPEKDFEGKVYTVVLYSDSSNDINSFYFTEGITGDPFKDAVYERNRGIEERFNTAINFYVHGKYADVVTYVQKSVLAGDNEFDVVSSHVVSLSSLAVKEVFMNWYDIPYINFEKPWWAASNINDLTYKNKVALLVVGDLAMTALSYTYCMYFDKQEAENYNLGDIYKIVLDGDWTIDKLSELTKDIYIDVNGDNTKDAGDFYGLSFRLGSHTNTFYWAFDNPVMTKNSDGTFELTVKTEKTNSILEKLISLTNDNPGTYTVADYTEALNMFINSRAIFSLGDIGNSANQFRSKESDFGIIPYPKWNDAQDRYYTSVNGAHDAMAVPLTVTDTEFTGIITEAMCAESYKQVRPAYYDVALKLKGARDETSIETLDLVVESRVFDFGFIYDNWKGPCFALESLVKSGNANYESYYASKEESIKAYYNSVFEALEAYIK